MNRLFKSGLVGLVLLNIPKLAIAQIPRQEGEGITFKTAQSFLGTVFGVGPLGTDPRFEFDYNGLTYPVAAYTDKNFVNQPLKPNVDTIILDYMAEDSTQKSNLPGVKYLNVPEFDHEFQIEAYIIRWLNENVRESPVSTKPTTWGSIKSLF